MVLKKYLKEKIFPLLKELATSSYTVSLYEVVFTIFLSNLAFFITAFIFKLGDDAALSFSELFLKIIRENIKVSEIFVFILGFTAPAIWIMIRYFRMWKHGFYWVSLLIIQAFVVGTTAIIFAMSLSEKLKNRQFAEDWSYSCLIIALIVWYLTLVYQKRVIEKASSQMNMPRPGNESGTDILKVLGSEQ